ncbi:MAG: tetratricopeptide repeat protein [Pirellulaceae bacterium]|nr:tetratricopeptide repeat protein [Pirellulaceae bacterium]
MKRGQRKSKRKTVGPKPIRPQVSQLSTAKKILFSLLMLVFVLGFVEVGLWAIGLEPVATKQDPFVGFSSQSPLMVEKQLDGVTVMETAPNKLRWFNQQRFSKTKSGKTFRVFCLGGSTTFGRPYDDATSFPGWLREFAMAANSQYEFEVINAGGISYASYRIVRVMEELAAYQPDLFVVYTGHNEFLEERTYRSVKRVPGVVRDLGVFLSHFRTYALADRMLRGNDQKTSSNQQPEVVELEEEVATRLDNGVGLDAYQRDDQLAGDVLEHFRYNLQRMNEIAEQVGAEVVLVTPAANLANCSPFKSQHTAEVAAQEPEWQKQFDKAQDEYGQGRLQDSLLAAEKAVAISPRHARTRFLYGQILLEMGQYAEAKRQFEIARNEDVCPLRAQTETVQVVREVAAGNQLELIDFEQFVQDNSEYQIAGESLFLDHVHPTIEGNRLLALQLVDCLQAKQVLQEPADWSNVVGQVTAQVESQVDSQMQGRALRNLAKVLGWAGKKEEADQLALKASQLIGGDAETAYLAGNAWLTKGEVNKAIRKFREAIRIDSKHVHAHNSLATALLQMGKIDDAETAYLRVISLQPDFAPAHNNLASLYQRKRESDRALHHFNEAIRLNPRYSKAHNNLGVLYRSNEDFEKAELHFLAALDINPDFAEAHYNLGTVLDRRDERALARDEFQDAIRINPSFAAAHYRLGAYFEDQRQWEAAVKAYQTAVRLPKMPLQALRRTAWLLATCPDKKIRNGKESLEMAKVCAKSTQFKDAESLCTLAAAYAEVGQVKNACKWQEQAVQTATTKAEQKKYVRLLEIFRQGKPFRQ